MPAWAPLHGLSVGCSLLRAHALLWHGPSTGCRVEIRSTMAPHGLREGNLLSSGLLHRLQSCSNAQTPSSPSFCIFVSTELFLSFSPCSSLTAAPQLFLPFFFLPFFYLSYNCYDRGTNSIADVLSFEQQQIHLGKSGTSSVRHWDGSCCHLREATPATSPLPNPCHVNPGLLLSDYKPFEKMYQISLCCRQNITQLYNLQQQREDCRDHK